MKTRIVRNPKILAGKPVIAGTRIPVALILNLLAHGQTIGEIVGDYPDLTAADVKAAVEYAQHTVEKTYSPATSTLHEISHRRRH
ncbi:MAG: DUF433 domain-containing protein [Patescibacteria group bacterium]|nr:DUF433 domain-containing protein [Patescibacteria group bacterium]